MRDEIPIGPNPCHWCGGEYGQHYPVCRLNASDTLRTDAEAISSCGIHSPEMVRSVFARQLERELNQWKNWHEQTRLGGQALAAERDKLLAAISEHHAQKADDRCVLDDDRLYAAAGLPPCDRRVGSKEDMLKNCARFIDRRCESGGWKSYIELEAELSQSAKSNLELRAFIQELESHQQGMSNELAALKSKLAIGVTCENCGGYLPGHATGAGDICSCER